MMPSDDNHLNDAIRKAFLEEGQVFPVTEDEVRRMEHILEEDGPTEIPPHLRAKTLAAALASNTRADVIAFPETKEIIDGSPGLARAARKGKGDPIPEDVAEKMRKDKADSESGKE